MKYFIILLFLLAGCQPRPSGPEVKYAGSIRAIMMEHNTTAVIALTQVRDQPHVYGLGAIAGLDGEIILLDGHPSTASVKNDTLSVQHDFDQQAALLVYASVKSWKPVPLPEGLDLKSLEAFIKERLSENNNATPAPFLITGKVARLSWHVVRGSHDPATRYQGKLNDTSVSILGFYSEEHAGVFTHHGSATHIHFISENETVLGHVDELTTGPENILLLPNTEEI